MRVECDLVANRLPLLQGCPEDRWNVPCNEYIYIYIMILFYTCMHEQGLRLGRAPVVSPVSAACAGNLTTCMNLCRSTTLE